MPRTHSADAVTQDQKAEATHGNVTCPCCHLESRLSRRSPYLSIVAFAIDSTWGRTWLGLGAQLSS